jgi:type I restriction enzyme M protein
LPKEKSVKTPITTAQQLGSLIKSARDIMRKDKGLNGDLDRLPMLTWVMFLKFFDDLENIHEQTAVLAGKPYKPIIKAPYRWRDWAAKEDGISGDDLTHFVNDQETVRPNGTKGKGLFEYLRQLRGTDGDKDQRDVIANIFRGVNNRMSSGFLLREIVNKVNGIHFSSSEEIHTLSHLYESMLKEMRDAAGDSGEFYTPRPVIKFMVEVTNPRLGETILDPACGTGGFLVEAFSHLSKQAKTVQHRRVLQEESIFGGEAKSLPYLLAEMNLLLHGVENPQIDPRNSLITPLRDIGDRDRADIILTNPPFGGEEETGIQGNFPEDKQTGETALLFLQLIMRKLRRTPKPGRAGVVVPNGTLFEGGVCARIKEELLKDFNLHTIVRFPKGVFAPYTDIETNLLFFDRSSPTTEIWYYEHPLPEGRKGYTKTKALDYQELTDCIDWWPNRTENGRAWKVPVEQVLKYDESGKLISANLDIKNPTAKQDYERLPPEQLIGDIIVKERKVFEILSEIEESLRTTTW